MSYFRGYKRSEWFWAIVSNVALYSMYYCFQELLLTCHIMITLYIGIIYNTKMRFPVFIKINPVYFTLYNIWLLFSWLFTCLEPIVVRFNNYLDRV